MELKIRSGGIVGKIGCAELPNSNSEGVRAGNVFVTRLGGRKNAELDAAMRIDLAAERGALAVTGRTAVVLPRTIDHVARQGNRAMGRAGRNR